MTYQERVLFALIEAFKKRPPHQIESVKEFVWLQIPTDGSLSLITYNAGGAQLFPLWNIHSESDIYNYHRYDADHINETLDPTNFNNIVNTNDSSLWDLDLYPEGTEPPEEGVPTTTPVEIIYTAVAGSISYQFQLNELVPPSSYWVTVVQRFISQVISVLFDRGISYSRGSIDPRTPLGMEEPKRPEESRFKNVDRTKFYRLIKNAPPQGGIGSPSRIPVFPSEAVLESLSARQRLVAPQELRRALEEAEDLIMQALPSVKAFVPSSIQEEGLSLPFTQEATAQFQVDVGEEASRQRVRSIIDETNS